MHGSFAQGGELFGKLEHFVRQFLAFLPLTNVMGKVNQKPPAGALVVEYDRGHVDPDAFSRARLDAHVKVGNVGVTPGALHHAAVLVAHARAERSHAFQDVVAGPVDGGSAWIAEQSFRALVPGEDFAFFRYCKSCICRAFQQRKQLTFQHLLAPGTGAYARGTNASLRSVASRYKYKSAGAEGLDAPIRRQEEMRYGSKNSFLGTRHYFFRLQFDVRVRNNSQFDSVGTGNHL